MKISRLSLSLCALTLALVALAGCGGGGNDKVPADAVAVVDGTKIKRSDYIQIDAQAKRSYKNQ
jgi:predicted small lipoprotein YifL